VREDGHDQQEYEQAGNCEAERASRETDVADQAVDERLGSRVHPIELL
jgi:hypothetical protein